MQIWPPVDPSTLSRQVYGAHDVRAIPGVGRALQLYGGMIGQMGLDSYAGVEPDPRPRVLEQPDIELARATFVAAQVEDYLLHGNATALVTARDHNGHIAALRHYPAAWWGMSQGPGVDDVRWYLRGAAVDETNVVHVQRGVDETFPRRGVGVVEQHVRTFDRAALQEESERRNLRGGGVPSVAVVAPQQDLTDEEADAAAGRWEAKFGGGGRRPAILPNGTEVKPLSWSPNDQQATLARQLSLTDLANLFNLDSYWLGAPGSSHTYRSAGPLFLLLLRVSLNAVVEPFEQTWGGRLLPRGRRLRFDRQSVLADDMHTLIGTLTTATGRPVLTVDEARTQYLGLSPYGGVADQLAETMSGVAHPMYAEPTDEEGANNG